MQALDPVMSGMPEVYSISCEAGGCGADWGRLMAGSSGGSAALVAARVAPAGFCTDTAGSCRAPGALTGTAGAA